MLVSFLLIAIYISFRFQWRFALPIVRTLFNDILITLGVYALSGREVTTATVAAILTVLGYSIYDTIIVFDRVRENMPLMPRAKFATIANISLWQTVRRSLATTFITLLPVASLLLFGGDTLKDFAFALFIGIGLGAISTFFVATPFLTVLMERSPEFRRRTDEAATAKGAVAEVPAEAAEKFGLAAPVEAPGDRRGAGAGGDGGGRGHRRRAVEVAGEARAAAPAAGGRVHMAEPASRDALERMALAAVGAIALTADRIDELAGDLSERGGMRRDEARQLLEDALTRWRGDATRFGERAGESLAGIARQLGLVTRDELDELELRVAQLEHRLRLVEGPRAVPSLRPSVSETDVQVFAAVRATLSAWRSPPSSATSGACRRSPRSRSGTGSATCSSPTS